MKEKPGRGRARPGRAAGSRVEGVELRLPGPQATRSRTSPSTPQPGERVAIVGQTGAGKTTLMSLLIRFYDPTAGPDRDRRRRPARPASCDSLRDQISVVLQEPLLFSGTIADNIRYGKLDATEERGRGRRPGGQRPRLHRGAAGRLRHRARRAGRADLRRRAPADLRRPRLPQGRADPDPRRADLLDRLEDRGGDPRRARRPDGGPDLVHDRPPPLDRPPRRPDPRPRRRADRRARHATRSCCGAAASTASCTRRRRASAKAARPPSGDVNGGSGEASGDAGGNGADGDGGLHLGSQIGWRQAGDGSRAAAAPRSSCSG